MINKLTKAQRKIIIAACDVQLSTFIELHVEGHDEFDSLLEEEPDIDEDTITSNLLEQVIKIEELKENPEKVFDLPKHLILGMQFIIMRMLPNIGTPNAKKHLFFILKKRYDKIKHIIELKNQN